MARIKKQTLNIPKTQSEVELKIDEIARLQARVEQIENFMNNDLRETKDKFSKQAQPINTKIDELVEGIQIYAQNKRSELTENGKRKSVEFSTGTIGWRTSPPSVRITGLADVLERLKTFKLSRFIRNKEEINKEAILNEPEAVEAIKGLNITQKEEFFIRPFESDLEKARVVK